MSLFQTFKALGCLLFKSSLLSPSNLCSVWKPISSNIYFLSLYDNAHRPYIITAIKTKMNGEIEAAHTAAHEPKSL